MPPHMSPASAIIAPVYCQLTRLPAKVTGMPDCQQVVRASPEGPTATNGFPRSAARPARMEPHTVRRACGCVPIEAVQPLLFIIKTSEARPVGLDRDGPMPMFFHRRTYHRCKKSLTADSQRHRLAPLSLLGQKKFHHKNKCFAFLVLFTRRFLG